MNFEQNPYILFALFKSEMIKLGNLKQILENQGKLPKYYVKSISSGMLKIYEKLSHFFLNFKINEYRPLFEQNTKLQRKKSSILETCFGGQSSKSLYNTNSSFGCF